jgi:hypothetical protein
MVAFLALLVLGGPPAPDELAALISRLGSPRSAERAAAAAALEQMGPAAVPALQEARQARDLELRARAAALLDAIDGRSLTLPTLVTLDFHDRSIAEVVAAIADRSKAELILEPEADDRWKSRRVSLEEPAPLPFWEALDRLCQVAGLRLLVGPEQTGFRGLNPFAPGGFPEPQPRQRTGRELILVANEPYMPFPVAHSGVVDVVLLTLHHQRDRVFGQNEPGFGTSSAVVRFTAGVQVRVEPRLTLLSIGPPEGVEAIDDRGQSLRPDSVPIIRRPSSPRFNGNGAPRTSVEIVLKYPERPGKTIRRLGGILPLLIAGRRPDPLVVPLERSRDRVFSAGETMLAIHDVKALPNSRGSVVELTLTVPDLSSPNKAPTWPTEARAGIRPPLQTTPQIDFVDAQGRVCQSFAVAPHHLGDGSRKALQVQPAEGTGPPVEVRYYELAWTRAEVPFAFENLPMP